MKIGYTVFKVFKSARLEDKALYRRWDCTGGRRTAYVCDALFEKGRYGERPYLLFQERSPYAYSQKGATASAQFGCGFQPHN